MIIIDLEVKGHGDLG